MSPRALFAMSDIDAMFAEAAEAARADRRRMDDARFAHLNRMHAEITRARRSLRRIQDDPAHHWTTEAVAS